MDYEPPFVLATGATPPPPPRRNEQVSARNPPLPRKEPQFYTRTVGDQTWRFAVMGSPYMTLILGANLDEFTAGMTQLRNTYLAALPVVPCSSPPARCAPSRRSRRRSKASPRAGLINAFPCSRMTAR